MSFRQDYCEYSDFSESNGKLNEIRARFNSFRDLDKLSRFLTLLSNYCKIPNERGGIHIHIDVSSWIDKTCNNKLKEYLNSNEVQSYILNLANGYSGKYNKRGVGYHTKGYYINISNHNSIEFRIFRLTFSYKEILRILLGLQKLVKKAKFICNGTMYGYTSTTRTYNDNMYYDEVISIPNLNTNSSNYNTWTMLSS